MATISLTLPVAGNVITAGLHATNYTAIQTFANGGIDNNNVSGSAALAYSKLALVNSILTTDISTGAGNAWTAYTPVWTSAGTAPAIGNGTLSGRWTQMGKTVLFWASMVAGSTTTFGSANAWTISLPTAAQASHPLCGVASPTDTGVAQYQGQYVINSVTTIVCYTVSSAAGVMAAWDNTHPFAWGNTDTFKIVGQYEAA